MSGAAGAMAAAAREWKLKLCFMGWGHSIHLRRWMLWFVRRGHPVFLITDHRSYLPAVSEYEVARYGAGRRPSLANLLRIAREAWRIRKILRAIKPDILHLHTLLYPSWLGMFSGVRRLVVTPWDGDIVWDSPDSRWRRGVIRAGLARAALITVDSADLKDRVLARGADESKIQLVSFGVDTGVFHRGAATENLRRSLHIPADAPLVFSSRSLGPLYNIDIIIRAIPRVLSHVPGAVFLFAWHAGSAFQQHALMRLARSLGVLSSVRFLGRVEHSSLAAYYAAADVYVTVPSSDTIAVSLLEAMACGAAPVVSDLPSTRECIEHGVNGYIVPVRDVEATSVGITMLLTNAALRVAFAESNRGWVVRNADWHTNMRSVEELYYGLQSR